MVVEEQVNLGRFLSAMRIEDTVLADSVLPNKTLDERASLIQGILKGMLERGDWQQAIHLVYTPGPVKALFDGDWEGFHDAVVASAKDKECNGVGQDLAELLAKNKGTALICRLIEELPYDRDHIQVLFNGIYNAVDEEARASLGSIIAKRAFEAKDFAEAYQRFKNNGDAEAISNIYAALLASPATNMKLLLRIADTNKDKLKEIVKTVLALNAKEMQKIKMEYGCSIESKLYALINETEIKLTDAEWENLRQISAEGMMEYDVGKTGDKTLALLWAKKHYKKEPMQAYRIFIEQKYKGDEVLEAVKIVFNKNYKQGLPSCSEENIFKQFKEEHLKAIYSHQALWMRIEIVRYLGDKKAMCALSKESFEAENFEAAYSLWLNGNGELDCAYMDKLRKEIKEISHKKLGGVSEFVFDREDTVGRKAYFEEIIGKHPYTAYVIARNLEDEGRMQRAREKLAANKPEYALGRFMKAGLTRIDGPDPKGAEMCIEALAKKYSIPKEQVKHYAELGKNKF